MSWLSRLVNVIRRDRVDRDLEEEMRFHLAARTDELVRGGMPAEDALAQARRQFGNTLLMRESSRDIKLFPRLESILRDVGFGLRLCLRNKTVTAAAVALSFTGHRRLHGRFLADRCADPAAVAGERSPVADLHRVARTRGHSGRPQLQLSPLRRNCAMRAGRRYGCSP